MLGSLAYAQETGNDGWAQLGLVDLLAFNALDPLASGVSDIAERARQLRPNQSGAPYCEALTDAVLSLIDGNASAWSHCNNFRFHVWWHKALLHLDKGETDHVLSLYDTRIRDE